MSSQTDIGKLQAGNLFSVDGLNILITGGGSGLGAYMCRALAVNGAANVIIVGRRDEALNRTKASLPEEYSKVVIPVTGDVTSKESLADVLKTITGEHGIRDLDVLICNSGTSGTKIPFTDPSTQEPLPSVEEISKNMLAPDEHEISNTYHVNLTGIHLTVATFLPLLDAANRNRKSLPEQPFKPRPQIITTSSIGGFNRIPLANLSYGPSKAGAIHMTKQLATILIPYDIRANTIAPGLYLSEMTEDMYKAQGSSYKHNKEGTFEKKIVPATRSGDEEDMGGVVLWLCSRAGGYINGCVVITDGGRMAVVPGTY